MILHRLRLGDRFRVGSLCGRLVGLSASAATIEVVTEPREFLAHDALGNPKKVRIAGAKRRVRISPDADVEVLS